MELVVKLYMKILESLLNNKICSYINQNGCAWFILKFDEKVNAYHVTTLFTLFVGKIIIYTCINTRRKLHIWLNLKSNNWEFKYNNYLLLFSTARPRPAFASICFILIDILPTPNSTVIFYRMLRRQSAMSCILSPVSLMHFVLCHQVHMGPFSRLKTEKRMRLWPSNEWD